MNPSAPEGLWDPPQPPFDHAPPSPLLPQPPTAPPTTTSSTSTPPGPPRRARVTSAPPAKRITFFRSGDNQFGGFRMAIHRRRFKCFDALLDDLSQKVPLPFGVRTVTTPRGTRSIKHLEQLQDGGCYLCSDHRQAKPVDLELAGKRPVVWQYQGRRPRAPSAGQPHPPHPPGGAHGAAAAAVLLRQRRRILLVKNSEPGLRRSVVLGRRNGRSLRAFLEEVSHVMQFHVHRLYTVDGRKIDSVQSLITCPAVLVCAGSREAFSAVLLDCSNRKNSEEKLPGLPCETTRTARSPPATQALSRSPPSGGAQCSPPRVARSRASDGSEGSKKSVNFGLETKKSVIHRRSDSSARSTRFSVSSEADKGCPLHHHHQARTVFGNDDIEKRVLVNKDGSLSVEMKVRFRLHNQETVQWSTHITKSPPASLLSSDCCPLKEDQPCYMRQGQSESCGSDPDSALSASCDHAVADYIAQSLPGRPLEEENRCPCCCQRHHEQYDLWENPVHSHTHPVCAPRLHASSRHSHSSSSSSSCHSRRVVRRRATRHSDSHSVREEEVCVMEEVQREVVEQSGDSCVEVCRIEHCSSRSEVEVDGDGGRSDENIGMSDGEERPPSAISNSSRVLQALQEDDDDHEEDNPSDDASPCCPGREPSLFPATPRPPSKRSVGSACSAERGGTPRRGEGGCQGNGAADQMDRAASSRSEASRMSRRSTTVRTPDGEDEGGAAADDEAERRVQSSSSTRAGSNRSRLSSACTHCGGCQRGSSTPASCNSHAGEESCSRASRRSHRSHGAPNGEADCVVGVAGASDDSDGSATSIQSNRSNLTHLECFSAMSNMSRASDRSKHSPALPLGGERPAQSTGPEEEEERAPSATSAASRMSRTSHRSDCGEAAAAPDAEASGRGTTEGEQEGENIVERAASTVSAKSNASARSAESRKSNGDARASAQTPAAKTADVEEADTNDTKDEVRASSALSTKSAKSDNSAASKMSGVSRVSKVSGVSRKSGCSHCGKAASPCPNGADNAKCEEGRDEEQEREEEEEMDGRAASALSAKSNLSGKSSKSNKPRSHSPMSEAADDTAVRAASAMSAKSTKSNVSAGSAKSRMSDNNGSSKQKEEVGEEVDDASLNSETGGEKGEGEEMEVGDKTEGGDEHEERAASATSVKSARSNLSAKSSKSHKSICKHTDIPTIETNGAEGGADEVHELSDERAASAMSAKSKLSVTSSGSRKCDSNGGKREGGEEKLEARSVSAMSAKSTKSNVSAAKSHRSGRDVSPAEVPVIETTDADDDEAKAVEKRTTSSVSTKTPTGGDGGSARSKSALSAASVTARGPSPSKTPTPRSPSRRAPSTAKGAAPYPSSTPQTPKRRQLLPGSEAGVRGSSALSVRSAASTRSNGSKCHCDKKEEEDEELENGEEKATERAASVLSASLGVERPLSGASMGSVSLGLPEDREHESMNSDISFHTRSNLSAMSSKVKPVDIPTIETTGGNEEANEGEMPTVERSASALSAKSNASAKSSRSQKSSSNVASPKLIRGTKGQDVSAGPAKTGHGKSTIYLNTPDNRTPSAMSSSSSNKVRIKSPTRASPKPTTPVPAGDSATIKPLRPSEGKGEDASSSIPRSPNRLRPQSAASSSRSDNKKSPPKESSRPKSAVAADDFKSPVEETWNSLSKSLSAADLLRETMAAGRPLSRGSKASERSGGASRASERRTEAAAADLTPACLPNASLNEVVSDWLKNIPTCMFAPGDELSDGGGHEQGKETDDGGRGGEEVEKEVEEVEKVEEEEAEEEEAAGDAVEEEKSDAALMPNESTLSKSLSAADLLRETMAADITPSHPAALFQGSNSSIAVMKVLLSPVTGRCRSLPEVSPVYGRRLSTSAQGLLSCLAQLHLIEPGSVSDSLSHAEPRDRNQRYSEIITLLQSLWLSKPKDKEAGQHGQVSPPRSSSGVGMSSGSGGSGNNGIDGGDGKAADNEAVLSTPVADTPGQGETEAGEDKPTVDDGTRGGEEESTHGAPELPAEPDGKEPSIPVEETTVEGPGVDSPSAAAAVVPEAPPPPPHQDPDPMWVLRLLKKLEKQFMNHYTDAMAEFKVRWALDDNLMLDAMIKELREEVSQRIQGSIGRELKKIQGRAGRAPRPPAGAQLSRESTMTDRRRRMLKVMKNQSIMTPESLSDDDTAGEYSDQRSDDDYCPCDACVRKKMEARPPKMHPAASAAPVMMAFDLRKILQQKKAPETPPPPPPAASAAPVMAAFDLRKILQVKKPPEAPPPSPPASPEPADGSGDVQEEGNILEVVHEEEEEEEEGETQRQEEEEEEEGKETGEEVEEEEEEEGERAEEECECRHPHETEGEGGEEEGEADEESSGGEKTEGETETDEGKAAGEGTETEGETENDGGKTAETEGEEDDSNKLTEATRDGGETSENDDGEQEKKEEEEEEEATGEEKSEDAVENEEESTPVEESTEGNTGASAEDDDEEDGEKGITEEDESGGETASTQRKGGVPLVCVTEGEDSDVGSMRPSEAGDGAAEDEGENEEDVVKEKQVNGLSHQYTRTSVESQPGSMEAIDAEPGRMASPLRPVKSQETGPKMVAGVSRGEGVSGKGQRRSRSPARVRRRKPNASDIELDDMDI